MDIKFNSSAHLHSINIEGNLINDFLDNCDKNQMHLVSNSLDILNKKEGLPPIASVITMNMCKNVVTLLDLDKVVICDDSKALKEFNDIIIDSNINEYDIQTIYSTDGLDAFIETMQTTLINYLTAVTEKNEGKLYLYGAITEFGYINPIRPLVPSVMIRVYMKLGDDNNE